MLSVFQHQPLSNFSTKRWARLTLDSMLLCALTFVPGLLVGASSDSLSLTTRFISFLRTSPWEYRRNPGGCDEQNKHSVVLESSFEMTRKAFLAVDDGVVSGHIHQHIKVSNFFPSGRHQSSLAATQILAAKAVSLRFTCCSPLVYPSLLLKNNIVLRRKPRKCISVR